MQNKDTGSWMQLYNSDDVCRRITVVERHREDVKATRVEINGHRIHEEEKDRSC